MRSKQQRTMNPRRNERQQNKERLLVDVCRHCACAYRHTQTRTHAFVGSSQCSWPRPQPKRGAIVSVPIMEAGPVGAH